MFETIISEVFSPSNVVRASDILNKVIRMLAKTLVLCLD